MNPSVLQQGIPAVIRRPPHGVPRIPTSLLLHPQQLNLSPVCSTVLAPHRPTCSRRRPCHGPPSQARHASSTGPASPVTAPCSLGASKSCLQPVGPTSVPHLAIPVPAPPLAGMGPFESRAARADACWLGTACGLMPNVLKPSSDQRLRTAGTG